MTGLSGMGCCCWSCSTVSFYEVPPNGKECAQENRHIVFEVSADKHRTTVIKLKDLCGTFDVLMT